MACAASQGCGDAGSMLLLKAMCKSKVLLHLGSVLMSIAHDTSEGHENGCGLCLHLKLFMFMSVFWVALEVLSESIALLQLVHVHGLFYGQKP